MRSTQSTFQTSLYATPFVLDRDVSNKYKVDQVIQKTQQYTNAIPFLRTPELDWNQATGKKGSTSHRNFSQDGSQSMIQG